MSHSPQLWATFPLSPYPFPFFFWDPSHSFKGMAAHSPGLLGTEKLASSPDLEPLGFCRLFLLNWYKPCREALLVCQTNSILAAFFICFNLSSICLSIYWLLQIPSNLQSRSLFPFTTQAHLTSTHRGSKLKYRDPRSPRVLWVSAFSFLLLA